jgi:hypothetical protein
MKQLYVLKLLIDVVLLATLILFIASTSSAYDPTLSLGYTGIFGLLVVIPYYALGYFLYLLIPVARKYKEVGLVKVIKAIHFLIILFSFFFGFYSSPGSAVFLVLLMISMNILINLGLIFDETLDPILKKVPKLPKRKSWRDNLNK